MTLTFLDYKFRMFLYTSVLLVPLIHSIWRKKIAKKFGLTLKFRRGKEVLHSVVTV